MTSELHVNTPSGLLFINHCLGKPPLLPTPVFCKTESLNLEHLRAFGEIIVNGTEVCMPGWGGLMDVQTWVDYQITLPLDSHPT